jgi:zinc transporter, ZIP family
MLELEGKRVVVTIERGRPLRRRSTPMGQALVFGLIGSSALVIGGVIGAFWQAPQQLNGILLAFASGTLISALAFELFPEAVHLGGLWPAGLGLIAGGLTFVIINTALDSWVARSAGDPHEVPALSSEAAEDISGAEAEQNERVEEAATQGASAAVGFALLAAVTLDGVPENLALGVSLLSGGGSIVLLVAIFCSNFPESLVGAVAMRRGGRSALFAIAIWALAAALLAGAVVFGRGVFAQLPEEHLAFPLAFAGGAVLASLADTLMPEAFEHGRPLNSMATAGGFLLSFVLSG